MDISRSIADSMSVPMMRSIQSSQEGILWCINYEPLRIGQIRILWLNLDESDVLSGCLQIVEFEKARYHAISYVWGEEDAAHFMIIGNQCFTLRRNLEAALRDVRAFARQNLSIGESNESPLPLWVDAICINQLDEAEIAVQVRQMPAIYESADTVFAHTGRLSKDTKVLAQVFKWLELYAKEQWWREQDGYTPGVRSAHEELEAWSQRLRDEHNISIPNLLAIRGLMTEYPRSEDRNGVWIEHRPWKKDIPPPSHTIWASAAALPKIEYFNRVWTYQEVTLAKRAYFMFGHIPIRGEVFHNFWQAFFCLRVFTLVGPLPLVVSLFGDISSIPTDLRYMDFVSTPRKPGNARRLLLLMLNKRCSRPHDFIYGMLGLMDPGVANAIKVDYSIPYSTVFAKTLKAISDMEMSETRLWEMSLLPRLWDGLPSFPALRDGPSWCPDFSHGDDVHRRASYAKGSHLNPGLVQKLVQREYVPVIGQDMMVTMKALRVGTVQDCADVDCPPPVDWRYDDDGGWVPMVGRFERRLLWLICLLRCCSPGLNEEPHSFLYGSELEDFLRATTMDHDQSTSLGDILSCLVRDIREATSNHDQSISFGDILSCMLRAWPRWGQKWRRRERTSAAKTDPERTARIITSLILQESIWCSEEDMEDADTNTALEAVRAFSLNQPRKGSSVDVPDQHRASCSDAFGNILLSQRGRFFFQLETGEIGFSPRHLYPGARVYLVPGAHRLHALSSDSSRYLSTASIPDLEAKLVDMPDVEIEERLETVYLH